MTLAQPAFGRKSTGFAQFLDTVGDGSGDKDAIGDYSVTPQEFLLQPKENETIYCSHIMVTIQDSGSIDAARYGNLGAALDNGIVWEFRNNDGVVNQFNGGEPIKTNADWASLCFDCDVKTWGTGDEILVARWRFVDSGVYLKMEHSIGDHIVGIFNDDFTGLIKHRFLIQGFRA